MIAGQNDQISIEAPTEQELIDYLLNFKSEILLWGSPKVIKAQLNFEKISKSGGNDIFIAMNNLYRAIREDIGLSNSGLDNLELVKIFLKDPEELDEMGITK